jgi:N6-L-threonylcarbamoyladenine synthase
MIVIVDLKFPYLGLIISGGHTQILVARGVGDYDLLGTTQDDAIGIDCRR